MVSIRNYANLSKSCKFQALKDLSFDEYLQVATVIGMTKGQIYLFSPEGAQIFPCWMLITQLNDYEFLWPILTAECSKLAVSTVHWYDLVIDDRIPFVCGETYRFQIPLGYLYGNFMLLSTENEQVVEKNLRIVLDKVKIDLVPDQFGEIDVCRLIVVDSDIVQLVVGKEVYMAETRPLDHNGFINWCHHATYGWRRTDTRNVVQLVPTIAVELDKNNRVLKRCLGQEILADWNPYMDEVDNVLKYGVEARICDLHLLHRGTERLKITYQY